MENVTHADGGPIIHSAHMGVECPRCHWKQFIEINLDTPQTDNPMAREIRAQLEAWIASRCPDHLNVIPALSKN
ncbi:MAG: hypothetical protein ACRD10_05290 [Terriglobia bacterium]